MAVVAAVSLAGCSLVTAKRPGGEWRPSRTPDCNPGRGAVVVDGAMAAGLGIGALASASESEAAALGLLAVAGVYTASAIYGNRSATRCEEAMQEHDAHVAALASPSAEVDVDWEDPEPEERTPPPRTSPSPEPAPSPELAPAPTPEPEPAATTDEGTWGDFWIEVSP